MDSLNNLLDGIVNAITDVLKKPYKLAVWVFLFIAAKAGLDLLACRDCTPEQTKIMMEVFEAASYKFLMVSGLTGTLAVTKKASEAKIAEANKK